MIIELHILQNFGPSCLNRDDTGAPKECEFGGYRRARISSQCIKRAIRDYFKDNMLISRENLGTRTLLIRDEIVRRLSEGGKDPALANEVVKKVLTALIELKNDGKTEYLLFLGEREIQGIVTQINASWDQLSTGQPSKEFTENLLETLDGGKAVDLALFGRMIANLPDKNIDAACQVAHAISTNKVDIEFDYFTAVDDLSPKEQTGAGMIGTIEFNSACYYRYANVDISQLKDNLQNDAQLTRDAWRAFVIAAVKSVPTGRQTTFSAQNPPDFVLAIVRDYGAWSLANAFLKPVTPRNDSDLTTESVKALVSYWSKLAKAYGTAEIKAKPVLSLVNTSLEDFQKVESLNDLIKELEKAVPL